MSTKKRADLGSSCHVGHGNATFVVDTTQLSKVPKITCDVSDRKPAPTCQEKFLGDFFLLSRPEHNQKPPTDTANRHCAFIPTRRKIAVWPQGAQSTAPLARGRSCALSRPVSQSGPRTGHDARHWSPVHSRFPIFVAVPSSMTASSAGAPIERIYREQLRLTSRRTALR